MRKPYRKGTVHPTPPLISDHLSFLPATILTLTAALSPEDRELLAYLISCSSTSFSGNRTTNSRATATTTTTTTASAAKYGADHPTSFGCYCFRCYMSYWVRWDSSPNRQLIHEIIDAFEEGLLVQSKKEKNKKERKKIRGSNGSGDLKGSEQRLGGGGGGEDRSDQSATVDDNSSSSGGGNGGAGSEDGGDDDDFEKGSVRRFVNFLGEKIWSVLA